MQSLSNSVIMQTLKLLYNKKISIQTKRGCLKKAASFCLLFFCFTLLPYSLAFATADSLEQSLLTTKADTNKIRLLNKLGMKYYENNAAKSLSYSYQAIALSKSLDFPAGLADAYNNIGIAYDIMGKYDSALLNYDEALRIVKEKTNNKRTTANIINNIGLVHWNKGEFDSALNYYLQSLKLFEETNNKKGQANTLSNIGLIYYDLKKFEQSLSYHIEALKIREELNDQYGIGVSQTNIGMTYSNLHDVPKALEYLKKSLITKRKNNDLYGEAISLGNIGVMFNEMQQYDSALFYQQAALPIRIKLNDPYGIISSYCNIASSYHDLNDYKTALIYSSKALPMAIELNSKTRLMKVYEYLAKEYKELGDLKKALEYYEKHSAIKDKVYSETSASQIAEMQTKYDTQKKDLELAKKDIEINNNQLEIVKHRNRQTILLVSIAALLLIFYVLYIRYRYKQKTLLNKTLLKEQEIRSKAVIEAEENERIRIARELHDGVGQHLSAVKLNISNLQAHLDLKEEPQQTMMHNALAIIDESVKEVRAVSHNMMPNALNENGIVNAVRTFVNRINSSNKLQIEFEAHGINKRLDSTIEIILYRIIQELVTNILRHSEASTASLQLIQHENELTLMVEDNGKGFDCKALKNVGIGLKNIQSRVDYLNGTINIDSQPQKGSTVTVEIPVKK